MVDLLQPSHCVSNNLHQTARAISRVYGEEMRPCGLKRSQFSILANLQRTGTIQLTELADLMYMDRTTLSRNLKPLENKGLILVRKSSRDARAREINISKAGKIKYREALKLWKKAQEKILGLFGSDSWQQLESSLYHLRQRVS